MAVIEFVGLPASGKSTIVKSVTTRLGDTHQPSQTTWWKRMWLKVRVLGAEWRLMALAVGALLDDPRRLRDKTTALRWLITTLQPYVASRSEAIIAEGVLQRSILLFYDAASASWRPEMVRKYVEAAPIPALAIHLPLSPEVAARRYRLRLDEGSSPTRFDESRIPLEAHMVELSALLDFAIECALASGWEVTAIPPSPDIDSIVSDLIASIDKRS